jgi:uncharacterized LabA/DUF88 family protein
MPNGEVGHRSKDTILRVVQVQIYKLILKKQLKMSKNRVIVYIDGFNLYFGMQDAGIENSKWLNIKSLIESYLTHNQELIEIKYFTSRITNQPGKQKRQTTYLEALETSGVTIIYGLYKAKDIECNNCGHNWSVSNEKMTDVNIATHLLLDAFEDKYDTAILISGDSDLVPPVKAIHKHFNKKTVSVFFPPNRHNVTVAGAAKGSQIIGKKKIKDHQFSLNITKKDGYILTKPESW